MTTTIDYRRQHRPACQRNQNYIMEVLFYQNKPFFAMHPLLQC